ncbi:hypothetical protein V8F20_008896 [Naviculisporaceae sp. PSN 640]
MTTVYQFTSSPPVPSPFQLPVYLDPASDYNSQMYEYMLLQQYQHDYQQQLQQYQQWYQEQYQQLYDMAYGQPSVSEVSGYQIPGDRSAIYQPPMRRTTTATSAYSSGSSDNLRSKQEKKPPSFQPDKYYPEKFIVDRVVDDYDQTVLAEMINCDPRTAWNRANELCSPPDQTPTGQETNIDDIVFFADASARRITEERNNRAKDVAQWSKMQKNPSAWRSGVAITWNIPASSPLNNTSNNAKDNNESTGTWHLATDKITPIQGLQWRAQNEAAYQIFGLQHFNQAELLGILFALERAVSIYRAYFDNINEEIDNDECQGINKGLSKSITILTDSKPAMWDLTGDNWRTDRIRADSEYWKLRRSNNKKIVTQAKKCMKMLRSLGVAVKIQWCPGHNDVAGNEWVDGLSRVVRGMSSRFKKNKNGEDIVRSECEEDGWEEMGLEGVKKEMVVDTGLGVFYTPDYDDFLVEETSEADASGSDSGSSVGDTNEAGSDDEPVIVEPAQE